MNRPISVLLAIALACMVSAKTSAMDLKQAYQAAFEQDAAINAARATAAAGREVVPQARAQLLPSLSASVSRSDNYLKSIRHNSLGQVSDSGTNYPSSSDSVTLRQPIYRWYQWAQYQQAQAQEEDSNAVLDGELQNLAVKVTGTYLEALLAQDQLALVRTQLSTYRVQLDAAKKLFAAGSGTRTDIDEVQARLDFSAAQEMEAMQNVTLTLKQLQVLVNRPVDRLASLDEARLSLSPPNPDDPQNWIELAEQASPELRALRARAQAAAFEVEKARAGHLPTLDATAQWSRSTSDSVSNIETTNDVRSFGLQLNIPIYSGGGVNSAMRQALANKERAEQIVEATRRDLEVKVFKEFRGVSEGVLRVRALEQAVKSAELALMSNQRSFQAGNRTRIDVMNAESGKMLALRDLAQARYIYLISWLRLKALVAQADEHSIEVINSSLAVVDQ